MFSNTGAIRESTDSFVAPFVVCGVLMTIGGVMCIPLRRLSKWEEARSKRCDPVKEVRTELYEI